ncbi:hypothetical protein NL676_018308 [Syzygium grande]|nr:hypothetical protein NL676_018308 [Syzygium grande]
MISSPTCPKRKKLVAATESADANGYSFSSRNHRISILLVAKTTVVVVIFLTLLAIEAVLVLSKGTPARRRRWRQER